MKTAQHLRKTNIVGYLLYMWQIEDMIRANDCDMNRIEENLIPRYDIKDVQEKQNLRQWFQELTDMILQEGLRERGHIQINKNVLLQLDECHRVLLNDPKETLYGSLYYQTLPFIVELRAKSGGKEHSEIETCLETLYGYTFLKMQQKEITAETQKAVEKIALFLNVLNERFFFLKSKDML